MRHKRIRRGISSVQWVVIAAVIVLVIFATVQVLGSRTNTKLNQTVTDVGNPANLTTRFGS